MFGQVVQLCHGKLFLVRDSVPGSFRTSPICSVRAQHLQLLLHVPPQAGIPTPWACPAFQSHSSVLTALCQMSLETLPAHQQLHLTGVRGLSTLERLFGLSVNWKQNENPKIYLGKKSLKLSKQLMEEFSRSLSLFLHLCMSGPYTALQNGKHPNFS